MNGIQIQAEARIGNDPELKEVSGTPVCNLSLAVTERKQNKQTGSWEDGTTTWMRAAVWGPMASNVASSLLKGQLVNVTGVLSERKWQTEQSAGSQLELRVDTISPSLRFAQAQVIPNERGGNAVHAGQAPAWQPQQQPAWQPGTPAQQAPWQTTAPPQQQVQQGAPQHATGQPGPQPGQQWATQAYQHLANDETPF